MMPDITLVLSRGQINLLLALLVEHPYKQVAELLNSIQLQANTPPAPKVTLGVIGGDGATS